MIEIAPGIFIGENELQFKTSRSSKPGGQNVNKLNSRVTLLFDLENSTSLTAEQKHRIRAKLSGRVSLEGVLQIVSQEHRTQAANRRAVLKRFQELLTRALRAPRRRIKTRVPMASRRRRLEEKHRRSQLKRLRSQRASLEE